MSNLAIIPARGGSKRIPRKNIREFVNKPLIAYSIETALKSKLFDRVIVSTDDEEIAQVACAYGAEVPFFRPNELSDDYIGTTDVVAHAINWLAVERRQEFDAVCCIYATAPFMQIADLDKAFEILINGNWQYVFSATSFGAPIFRGFEKKPDDTITMFFPEHFATRSQDLPEAMHDAGQFYWGRPQAWCDNLKIFDQWSTVLELPRWRVQDIDTLDDWARAEMIYHMLSMKIYEK